MPLLQILGYAVLLYIGWRVLRPYLSKSPLDNLPGPKSESWISGMWFTPMARYIGLTGKFGRQRRQDVPSPRIMGVPKRTCSAIRTAVRYTWTVKCKCRAVSAAGDYLKTSALSSTFRGNGSIRMIRGHSIAYTSRIRMFSRRARF